MYVHRRTKVNIASGSTRVGTYSVGNSRVARLCSTYVVRCEQVLEEDVGTVVGNINM
jgi:hypothetical protein